MRTSRFCHEYRRAIVTSPVDTPVPPEQQRGLAHFDLPASRHSCAKLLADFGQQASGCPLVDVPALSNADIRRLKQAGRLRTYCRPAVASASATQ